MADPGPDNVVLALLRELRSDLNSQRTLLLQLPDAMRRLEKRLDARMGAIEVQIVGMRDDIELMLKSELIGRLTHFETTFEIQLDALARRIENLEAK